MGRGTGFPDRSRGAVELDVTGAGGPGFGDGARGEEGETRHPNLSSQKLGVGSEGVRKKAKGGKRKASAKVGNRWDEVRLEGELSCETLLRSSSKSHALKRISEKVHECVKRVYGEDFVERR